MRHQKKTIKLGRTAEHRKALLANQVCSLIEHQRIKTTLAKARAVRPLAERMVTLGKNGAERHGGYTRIVKLGHRKSDSARMAFIEWVDMAEVVEEKATEEKKRKKKPAEPKAEQIEPERVEPEEQEPAEKEEEPAGEPAPPEEAKPKKRRWFGRKSSE